MWARAGAPPWILKAIKFGASIPFINGAWPPKHFNNHISIPGPLFGWSRAAIKEMLKFKAIRKAASRPHVVCPLVVSLKPSSTLDKRKYRLCHNLRWLNEFITKMPFKLDSVQDFASQLEEDDGMINVDMESGYFHMEIEERFRCLLGFEFEGSFYEFCCLPFGLRCSAAYFQAATAFCTAHIANMYDLKSLTYIDDLGFGGNGKVFTQAVANAVIAELEKFGWVINFEKSCLTLSTCITLLGFIVDSHLMEYRIPEKRKAKMLDAARFLLTPGSRISARAVQRVAGHIASLTLALGVVCRLRSRYMLSACRSASISQNWDVTLPLPFRARDEVKWWVHNLAIIKPRKFNSFLRKPSFRLTADASDSAQAAWLDMRPGGACRIPVRREFDVMEQSKGSMHRELIGYRDTLKWLIRSYDVRGHVILLIGDALSAVFAYRKGGTQQMDESGELPILELVLEMYELLWVHKAELILYWRPRRFLHRADSLSKVVDRHDFSISKVNFNRLERMFGPFSVDAFASASNTTVPRYFSQYNDVQSVGWDAFAQDWSSERLYILPPFTRSCFGRILDKIQRDRASGILVIPVWIKDSWFRRLFSQMKCWIEKSITFTGSLLVANSEDCFFGSEFECRLRIVVFRPPHIFSS